MKQFFVDLDWSDLGLDATGNGDSVTLSSGTKEITLKQQDNRVAVYNLNHKLLSVNDEDNSKLFEFIYKYFNLSDENLDAFYAKNAPNILPMPIRNFIQYIEDPANANLKVHRDELIAVRDYINSILSLYGEDNKSFNVVDTLNDLDKPYEQPKEFSFKSKDTEEPQLTEEQIMDLMEQGDFNFGSEIQVRPQRVSPIQKQSQPEFEEQSAEIKTGSDDVLSFISSGGAFVYEK